MVHFPNSEMEYPSLVRFSLSINQIPFITDCLFMDFSKIGTAKAAPFLLLTDTSNIFIYYCILRNLLACLMIIRVKVDLHTMGRCI